MSVISDLLAQIRTAVYGREVRESIASGIEQCYTDVQSGVTTAETAATAATSAASAANTAASAANTAATNAERVDISQSKANGIVTITTTNRNNQQTSTTLHDTEIDDASGNGDTDKVWSADKLVKEFIANVPVIDKSISTEAGFQQFDDGAEGMPMKVVVGIEPVQDLHGYEFPWIGGEGKNLINAPDVTLAEAGDVFNGACKLAAGTYTLSSSNTSVSVSVAGVSGTMPLTFTLADAVTTLQITASGAGTFNNIQIESGSSATDFAPYENICPISGWTGCKITRTGKNLLGGTALRDALLTAIPSASHDATNKVVYFAASSASAKKIVSREYEEGYAIRLPFKENTQYSFISTGYNSNTTTGTTNINIFYTDGTSDNPWFNSTAAEKSTRVFVSDAGKTIAYIRGAYNKGTSYFYYEECGIFEGALTAADFKPYQGNTYNISFPAGAGTVYGGTLTVNKDGSGSLVVDRVAYAFGSADTFTKVGSGSGQRFSWYKNTLPKPITGTSYYLCTHFKNATVTSSTTSFGIYCYYSSGNNFPSVTIRTKELVDGTMDAAGFNQWIADQEIAGNPVVLVYTMATPGDPIALTPGQVKSLLGYNAMWADTGNIKSIEYCADSKLYIEASIASAFMESVASVTETQEVINEYGSDA